MLNEPDLQLDTALQLVAEAYGLDIQQMEFVPKGEVAWCYKLVDSREHAFLLRVTLGVATLSLANVDKLKDLDFVVLPIDNLVLEYEGYSLALYEFVAGETMWEQMPDAAQIEVMGRCFALLHQTARRCGPFERQEKFSLDFAEDYHRYLEILVGDPPVKSHAAVKLQKRLVPLLGFLKGEYEKAVIQKQDILERDAPFVNCHGDPNPANIIVADEQVYLVDLEDLVYAPKEQDLLYFSDNAHFASFMQGYRDIEPQAEVDWELRVWYGRKWFLSEVTDYCQKILCCPHTEAEYAHYLQQMDEVLQDVGLL
jgi:aminoglycoside phosphotransferase (APT) family kinase protein